MRERVQPLVAGAMNFRDTGGLAADSGFTRQGVLFRSGNLAYLDDDGREALRDLGIRRIIDLRDDDEVSAEPSLIEGLEVDTVRAPLFLGSAASFFVDDISLQEMYRGLIDTAADRIVAVVRAVIAAQPALVHCTVGKDRTGVTVALLLSAVGAEREAVIADYARTEELLPAERNERVVAHLRRFHPEAKNLEELATRSPAEVMREMLADLDRRFGSPAGYLLSQGVTESELEKLREILIADQVRLS